MVLSPQQAAANYKAAASLAGQKYKTKVTMNTNWQANASSPQAESNYGAAVAAAVAAGTRAKGVQRVSQSAWVTAASTTGAANLPAGMTNHADKFQTNVAPVLAQLDTIVASLPPRGINYAANRARVDAVAQGLETWKQQTKG